MANNADDVMAAYLDAMASLREILSTLGISKKARKAAEDSVKDLTTALGIYNIKKVSERTALLNALIVELGEVVSAAKGDSKIQSTLKTIEGHVGTAKNLVKIAKEELAKS